MYGADFRAVPKTELSLTSRSGVMDSINSWQQHIASIAKQRSSFEPWSREFLLGLRDIDMVLPVWLNSVSSPSGG